MTLFDRVKQVSNMRGMSLQSLAEKAGMGSNSIYGWKNKKPSIDKISAVADILGVSVDYLLNRTDNASPDSTGVKSVDMDEMLEDDELLMSFQGKEISKEYRDAILAILRTMPNLDEDGKEV